MFTLNQMMVYTNGSIQCFSRIKLQMNSKQRVQAVLNRQMPDSTPIGFFAIDSDTAAKVLGRETYWRAKAKCQIAFWEGRRDEVVQSWIADAIELYKKLDIIDIIPVCCVGFCPPKDYKPVSPRKIDEMTWEDKEGRIYKYSPYTKDITIVHDPNTFTREFKIEKELWDGNLIKPDESIFEAADAIIEKFKQDRFILGACGLLEGWYLFGGMERGFMEIATRPSDVKRIYISHVDRAKVEDNYYIRDGQDGVLLCTDFSSQSGPMINPKTYRELFLDAYKDRINNIKSNGIRVLHHACGNNWPFLDIFAELGIECYQSVQESAGMNIIEIHKRYSDKFAVWGGVQVEHLIEGSNKDVRYDVDIVMKRIAPKGRFILGTSHSVAIGTKYDNFMALLDQFNKWR